MADNCKGETLGERNSVWPSASYISGWLWLRGMVNASNQKVTIEPAKEELSICVAAGIPAILFFSLPTQIHKQEHCGPHPSSYRCAQAGPWIRHLDNYEAQDHVSWSSWSAWRDPSQLFLFLSSLQLLGLKDSCDPASSLAPQSRSVNWQSQGSGAFRIAPPGSSETRIAHCTITRRPTWRPARHASQGLNGAIDSLMSSWSCTFSVAVCQGLISTPCRQDPPRVASFRDTHQLFLAWSFNLHIRIYLSPSDATSGTEIGSMRDLGDHCQCCARQEELL